jgi:hypothetical protein
VTARVVCEAWWIVYLVGLASGEGSESRLGRAGGLAEGVSIDRVSTIEYCGFVNRYQLTEST